MASIPSNGYAEVMGGTNNYSGSNSFDATCPRTPVAPVIGNDLTNKTYVDAATGGGILGTLTDKGSLITANGTIPVVFDENPYQTALTTITVYDWNSLAIGQSRDFTTTVPTLIPLGAGITITYSGTDSIKGTVTAVAGTTITLTITNFASASYSSSFLLQTSSPGGAGAFSTNGTFPFNPAITTPNPPDIPANTIITDGVGYIYTDAPAGVPITITPNIIGSNIQRPSATPFITIPYEIFPSTPTSFNFPSGCFVGTTQSPSVQFLGGNYLLGIPAGGSAIPPDYAGSLSGYTLTYGTGSIVIDDDIALIADALSPTGLAWGVINTASIGAVTSVSGGTSIVMSGTVPAPIVNLNIADTNANATYYPTFVAGSGTQALLADIATGPISLNPSNGNFNVVDTLKLTQGEVAVGKNAGLTSQGQDCVAVGNGAGENSQDANSIAIGLQAGQTSQKTKSVAIGELAGQSSQGSNCIAIGELAGQSSQGNVAIGIGYSAGKTSQGIDSIAIGSNAAVTSQNTKSIAIGVTAGQTSQGYNCIAIGELAGNSSQGNVAIGIGYSAGKTSQGIDAIAIGSNAGVTSQGIGSIAIGYQAANDTQARDSIAIGSNAGQTSQATKSIAIGVSAGQASQGQDSVAVGDGAGQTSQSRDCVAIGFNAGNSNQTRFGVAVGYQAGESSQGQTCVAIGEGAGQTTQSIGSIAIGYHAGQTTQARDSIAIGTFAGLTSQAQDCVAIGWSAGKANQTRFSVAVGYEAGETTQGETCVAIGQRAGNDRQSVGSIAIGYQAGQTTQARDTIAIGTQAGETSQRQDSVAIGIGAGQGTTSGLGTSSVAIGAYAGNASQVANSICINASGLAVNPANAGCYIRPIRGVPWGLGVGVVRYDPASFELTYSTN